MSSYQPHFSSSSSSSARPMDVPYPARAIQTQYDAMFDNMLASPTLSEQTLGGSPHSPSMWSPQWTNQLELLRTPDDRPLPLPSDPAVPTPAKWSSYDEDWSQPTAWVHSSAPPAVHDDFAAAGFSRDGMYNPTAFNPTLNAPLVSAPFTNGAYYPQPHPASYPAPHLAPSNEYHYGGVLPSPSSFPYSYSLPASSSALGIAPSLIEPEPATSWDTAVMDGFDDHQATQSTAFPVQHNDPPSFSSIFPRYDAVPIPVNVSQDILPPPVIVKHEESEQYLDEEHEYAADVKEEDGDDDEQDATDDDDEYRPSPRPSVGPSSLPTRRTISSSARPTRPRPNRIVSYPAALSQSAPQPEWQIESSVLNLTKRSRGRQVPTVRLPPSNGSSDVEQDFDDEIKMPKRPRRQGTRRASARAGGSAVLSSVLTDPVTGKPRTFVCTVHGCGKCFQRGEHLKRHVRSIHTNEKPFKCDYPGCGKDFSRRDNLFQHTSIHQRHQAASSSR